MVISTCEVYRLNIPVEQQSRISWFSNTVHVHHVIYTLPYWTEAFQRVLLSSGIHNQMYYLLLIRISLAIFRWTVIPKTKLYRNNRCHVLEESLVPHRHSTQAQKRTRVIPRAEPKTVVTRNIFLNETSFKKMNYTRPRNSRVNPKLICAEIYQKIAHEDSN
jgi:hypothetical protein